FFSSRRRHTRFSRDWSSDVCSSDLTLGRVHRFESRFERWRPKAKDTWRDGGTVGQGAGILYDLGPHLIDQAINLFGPVAGVYAELDARRAGGAAEDDAFLALAHRSGAPSQLG